MQHGPVKVIVNSLLIALRIHHADSGCEKHISSRSTLDVMLRDEVDVVLGGLCSWGKYMTLSQKDTKLCGYIFKAVERKTKENVY